MSSTRQNARLLVFFGVALTITYWISLHIPAKSEIGILEISLSQRNCAALMQMQSIADRISIATYRPDSMILSHHSPLASHFDMWIYNDQKIIDVAVSFSLREQGVFNPEVLEQILLGMAQGPAGGILWDIGANIGSVAFHVAAYGYRGIAFEPDPQNALLFALSQCSNKQFQGNISLRNYALGDKDVICGSRIDHINPSNFQIDCGQPKDGTSPVHPVHVKRLDAPELRRLLREIPSVVKLDTQGFEHHVIRGGMQVFKDKKPKYVVSEVDGKLLRKASSGYLQGPFVEIIEYLDEWWKMGYEVHVGGWNGLLLTKPWESRKPDTESRKWLKLMVEGDPMDVFMVLNN